MIQKQTIDIPLGGGLDTKTDPKLLPSGKALVLENAEFVAPGAVNKRNGHTALALTKVTGGSVSAGAGMLSYRDQLILSDGERAYSYSSFSGKWIDKGPLVACQTKTHPVGKGAGAFTSGAVLADCAYYNGLICYVFNDASVLRVTIVDTVTGAEIVSGVSAGGVTLSFPRVVATSAGIFYIVYNSTTHLKMAYVDSASPTTATTFGDLQSDFLGTGLGFDIAVLGTNVVCAYRSSTGTDTRVFTFNTTGVVIAAVIGSAEAAAADIGVCVTAASDTFVTYRDVATGNVRCFALTSALASRFAAATVTTNATAAEFVGVETSTANTVRWFYDSNATNQDNTATFTMTSAGVSVLSSFIRGVRIASRPIRRSGTVYVTVWFRACDRTVATPLQGFYALVNDSGVVAARFLDGFTPPVLSVSRRASSIITVDSSTYYFPAIAQYAQDTVAASGATTTVTTTRFGVVVGMEIAFGAAPQGAELGGNLICTGGLVREFDGANFVEQNFNNFPDSVSAADAGGGFLADGSYQVQVVYAWFDSNGQIHRSTPSPAITATVSGRGGNGTITVTVPTLRLTDKGDVVILAYMTAASGTTFYEAGKVANDLTTDQAAITIGGSTGLTSARELYTTGGILENFPPPCLMSIVKKGNRIYGVTADGAVWYTKDHIEGEGAAFVDGVMVKQLHNDGGGRWAISELDGRLVCVGARSVQVLTGEGLDDVGSSDTLSEPQAVATDMGIANRSPIVSCALGVLYKSEAGIVLIDRSLSIQLIGAAVDSYKTLSTVSAVLVPHKNQIRFGHSDGSALVYDYLVNQWSIFTAHTQVAATYSRSAYCFVTSAGQVYRQSTAFVDDAASIGLVEETPWIHIGAIGGMQRVLMLSILGEWRSAHILTAKIYLDHDGSVITETVTWDLSAGYTTGQPLHVRHRMGHQCRAIKVRLEDSSQAGTKESLAPAMLTLEVGGKPGVYRLGTVQTG